MRHLWLGIPVVVIALHTPSRATAQSLPKVTEEEPGLLAQARITPDSAIKIAMGRVPGGRITEAEIEMEGGLLVYSFDFVVAGKEGKEEVEVDALTGAVVGALQEDADDGEDEDEDEDR